MHTRDRATTAAPNRHLPIARNARVETTGSGGWAGGDPSARALPACACISGCCAMSRDIPAGRALDRRSEGPWFDPGSRHAIHCVLDFGIVGFPIRLLRPATLW